MKNSLGIGLLGRGFLSGGDLRSVFEREFQGMVVEPVRAEELRITGEQLVFRLHEEIT